MALSQKQIHRSMENRIQNTDINLWTYCQLIYDKGGRIYKGEKAVSSISGAGKTRQPNVKE